MTGRQRPLPLRQMGIGELLDAAIRLYRTEWLVLMGIVAFVMVPLIFLQSTVTQMLTGPSLADPTGFDPSYRAVYVGLGFAAVQFLIVQPFLVAAVARAATDVYMGEPVGIGRTYRFALSRIPAILWITILTSLATLFGFILLVIPGIIAAVRLAFASTILVVEGRRGTDAVRRSWNLAKGHFWRLLGAMVLAGLIAGIVAAIIGVPAGIVSVMMGPDGWAVEALVQALATVVTTPFSALVIVLLYFDLRIRKEGFDIEVMAQELQPSS